MGYAAEPGMGRRAYRASVLFPAIVPIVLGCLFAPPGFAGDNVQVVPICSDDRGDHAWVEIESTGERMKATPFVGGDGVKKLLENPNENGALSVPVPRLMRLVERVRQSLRQMKRPAPSAPAAPDAARDVAAKPASPAVEQRETARRPTMSLGPPDRTGAAIHPPPAVFSAADR